MDNVLFLTYIILLISSLVATFSKAYYHYEYLKVFRRIRSNYSSFFDFIFWSFNIAQKLFLFSPFYHKVSDRHDRQVLKFLENLEKVARIQRTIFIVFVLLIIAELILSK